MAVFLRDNIASVADQIVRESDLLVYIPRMKLINQRKSGSETVSESAGRRSALRVPAIREILTRKYII